MRFRFQLVFGALLERMLTSLYVKLVKPHLITSKYTFHEGWVIILFPGRVGMRHVSYAKFPPQYAGRFHIASSLDLSYAGSFSCIISTLSSSRISQILYHGTLTFIFYIPLVRPNFRQGRFPKAFCSA